MPKLPRKTRSVCAEHQFLLSAIVDDKIVREDLRLALLRELDKTEAYLRRLGYRVAVSESGDYEYHPVGH